MAKWLIRFIWSWLLSIITFSLLHFPLLHPRPTPPIPLSSSSTSSSLPSPIPLSPLAIPLPSLSLTSLSAYTLSHCLACQSDPFPLKRIRPSVQDWFRLHIHHDGTVQPPEYSQQGKGSVEGDLTWLKEEPVVAIETVCGGWCSNAWYKESGLWVGGFRMLHTVSKAVKLHFEAWYSPQNGTFLGIMMWYVLSRHIVPNQVVWKNSSHLEMAKRWVPLPTPSSGVIETKNLHVFHHKVDIHSPVRRVMCVDENQMDKAF